MVSEGCKANINSVIRIFVCLLLMMASHASVSKNVLGKEFSVAYIDYVEADTLYLTTFSQESKKQLLEAGLKLKKHAKKNPAAQLAYGRALYLANPKKNGKTFKKMLLKSASKGYLPATRKLARFYRTGQHFGKQPQKALTLLEENASFGHARDIEVLLTFYKKKSSKPISENIKTELEVRLEQAKSPDYMLKMAEAGKLSAQRVYGHMLYSGKYTSRRFLESAFWLTLAINNPENTQKEYDATRLIYARSKLTKNQLDTLDKRLAESAY